MSSATEHTQHTDTPFSNRILPAISHPAYEEEDYWVWCGSSIKGDDGKYHLFVSRWPKSYIFFTGYQLASEVIRAESDTPEGPYQFKEVVLPDRGDTFWDGRMTHNPTVLKYKDRYLLFYIGGSFKGERPSPDELKEDTHAKADECYASFCVGVAESKSIHGPWKRRDAPVLKPRPNKWDSSITTNPAPCICPDGSLLLYYRSNTEGLRHGCKLGVAHAKSIDHSFERLSENPILDFGEGKNIEDPFVWWNGDCYELIAKDLTGDITGEFHAGVHATSTNGVDWQLAKDPKAYSRIMQWDNGETTNQGSFERPQILFDDGVASYLFAATADGPGGFRKASRTWNMVVPLRKPSL